MNEKTIGYYPNAICFQDTTKVNIFNNWFDHKFDNIFISFDRCQNQTEVGGKCKSKEDIHDFMATNLFYVVT